MLDKHGDAELMQRLPETLGASQSFRRLPLNRQGLDEYNCVVAFDAGRFGQASGSGMNRCHGQVMRYHDGGMGNGAAHDPSKSYTTVRPDGI